jgi:acetyl-CoA carboxylase carboxyl transferase subunit alpha
MSHYLEFEKPLEELQMRLQELQRLGGPEEELQALRQELLGLRQRLYSNLSPWQKCLVARHPERPQCLQYISLLGEDFLELHGDRRYGDDPAVIGGLMSLEGQTVMVLGQQKGRTLKERLARNFGQPHPEGYRKALRLMRLAERFGKPVITLVDTPGAYPGVGAEERGQAEAIATNLQEMSRLRVPIVSVIIGEGGSGGALALAVADRLYMMEHAVFSVISPEGCAAILWRRPEQPVGQKEFAQAAQNLKLTAQELKGFGLIDGIIAEPPGGAHADPEAAAQALKGALLQALRELKDKPHQELLRQRYEKLRAIRGFATEG